MANWQRQATNSIAVNILKLTYGTGIGFRQAPTRWFFKTHSTGVTKCTYLLRIFGVTVKAKFRVIFGCLILSD